MARFAHSPLTDREAQALRRSSAHVRPERREEDPMAKTSEKPRVQTSAHCKLTPFEDDIKEIALQIESTFEQYGVPPLDVLLILQRVIEHRVLRAHVTVNPDGSLPLAEVVARIVTESQAEVAAEE